MSLLEFKRLDYEFSDDLTQAFMQLRGLWETPDNWPIPDPPSLWRHGRDLACGYYYRWNPRPPKHWFYAYRAWALYVRQVIHNRRLRLNTEAQVAQACAGGRLAPDLYNAWQQVKPDYEPRTEPLWLDREALDLAYDWLMTQEGIVWVEDVALGEMLSRYTKVPFYGPGKCLSQALGPVIASVEAQAQGPNLKQWHRNLVLSCPADGCSWEQMIRRTHHDDQPADKVKFEIVLACKEQIQSLYQALSDARFLESTTGQPQKLIGENKWKAFLLD